MRVFDQEELAELNAEPWMVEAIKLNPPYVHWGPHEDYMGKGEDKGWEAPVLLEGWSSFGWQLDELNECVNFYFSVERDSVECEACGGECYNPATARISRAFYDFEGTGRRRCDKITQDEADHLWEQGRLRLRFQERPSAEDVNTAERRHHVHDAINRWMLIEVRAKREGVFGWCETCKGSGRTYTEDAAHLTLTLWMLHPRKGASRGVEIKRITKEDLSLVVAWLKEAAQRNAQRFAAITSL